MNWNPDNPIDYREAEIYPAMLIMVQSNYSHSYKFWTFPEEDGKYDHQDVAIWRVKALKQKV